ncbi:MAG: ABC transporter permease [Pseudomonadota bacterium]
MGERRFGRVNWLGLETLIRREVQRFMAVYAQTIGAPVATSALFMLVFSLAFGERRGAAGGLPFEVFLAPGILMMSVIQNAFSNTSSSLLIAKIQGNIVDTLMPPLSAGEILVGYVVGGVIRGLVCAVAIAVLIFPVVGIGVALPLWALWFLLIGCTLMALIGLIVGIFADKFDQLATVTNFVITPLAFLSGTFYSVEVLPPAFQALSQANPFFYLIDGFRYGVLGQSDASPWVGFALTLGLTAALWGLAWVWLARGYRLKN